MPKTIRWRWLLLALVLGAVTFFINETSTRVTAHALLVRADQNTPFKYVQKVMSFCGLQGIQIWKVQLAAKEPEGLAMFLKILSRTIQPSPS